MGNAETPEPKITTSADGFEIEWRDEVGSSISVGWSAVTGAIAYKRDLFGYDLICLSIGFAPQGAIEAGRTDGGVGTVLPEL